MNRHLVLTTAIWLALAPVHAQQTQVSVPKTEMDQLLTAYQLIKSQYVVPVDDKKLLTDAIAGMLAGLDPHSQYLDKEDIEELAKGASGQYVGIGVDVEFDRDQIHVISTTEGGSAERAGVDAGDIIVSIDGKAVAGMRGHEIAKRMRGAQGSFVTLGLSRPGETTVRTLRIARAAVRSNTVTAKTVAPGVGWIRLSGFEGKTSVDLVAALRSFGAQGKPKGLVLDLRNNPGGMVSAAVGVAAAFLPPGTALFSARGRLPGVNATVSASPDYYRTAGESDPLAQLPDWARTVPLTVLVNGASASSAELVAGALQDSRRAKIVGSQTFGKGSIQSTVPLSRDSAVKMTVARYYTPKGNEIQARGIVPDVVVQPKRAVKGVDVVMLREADLEHHLPATGQADAGSRPRALAENTRMFGTSEDKALAAAVAALTAPGATLARGAR